MKKTFTSLLFFLIALSINAQCVLDMTVSVDGTGNIVTTNSSTGADPLSYTWYVYNLDVSPWLSEHHESGNTITYAPLTVGNYFVCLIAAELGTNNACDSLCDTLTYTQSMFSMQNVGIGEVISSNEVTAYPIPAHDALYLIDSDITQNSEFEVFDLLGSNYSVKFSLINNRVGIDISLLPHGVYFLKIKDRNQVIRFVTE